MKKAILTICFMLLAGLAYATIRPGFLNPTGDGTVTASNVIVVDANIYWSGLTVGDKVELKKGSSTGTAFCTIVADTANGNKSCPIDEPMMVDGGIYMDQTISGGITGMNLIYQ